MTRLRRADLIAEYRHLTANGMSITEIAAHLGYASPEPIRAALRRYERFGLPDYRTRAARHTQRGYTDGCRCFPCVEAKRRTRTPTDAPSTNGEEAPVNIILAEHTPAIGDEWYAAAACRGMAARGDDPWFGPDTDTVGGVTGKAAGTETALKFCACCPVVADCLADCLRAEREAAPGHRRVGVFGGTTPHQRDIAARREAS